MTGKGLEDVIAAQTSISDIDGKMGRLFYVGYDIHDLAPHATFEEIIHLLHNLRLPTETELDTLNEQLIAERAAVVRSAQVFFQIAGGAAQTQYRAARSSLQGGSKVVFIEGFQQRVLRSRVRQPEFQRVNTMTM